MRPIRSGIPFISTVATLTAAATLTAGAVSASPQSFCDELGASFGGTYCTTIVTSVRHADRHFKVEVPPGLSDDAMAGPVVRDYLRSLFGNWRSAAAHMAQDSYAEAHVEIHSRGAVTSVIVHESYHADGPGFNNAYRTFVFGAGGQQLGLHHIVELGRDPMTVLPPLIEPYLVEALASAPPAHQPNTYPFTSDRWGPDRIYSGQYRAWALTSDSLLIYMPDYPVAHDVPINYSSGMPVWSMNGGTVRVRVPLAALAPVLRPEYRE